MKQIHPKYHLSGFTLIELLVVISIIGMLSAITIGGINQSRMKSADANIKLNLESIILTSQEYYGEHREDGKNGIPRHYMGGGKSCSEIDNSKNYLFNDTKIFTAIQTAAIAVNGSDPVGKFFHTICYNDFNKNWAVSVPLRSDPSRAYCVDSTGASWIVRTGGVNGAGVTDQVNTSQCGDKIG